jgi:hypothetical protein
VDDDERTPATGASAQGARVGAQVGSAVGAAVGQAVEEATLRAEQARTAAVKGYGTVREKVASADTGAVVKQLGEVLEGVVEDGRERALSAFGRTPPPKRSRWPWAAGAVVAGAAAGAAVAFAVRRLVGQDAPGAQEPDQLRAVVDTGTTGAGTATTVPVVVPPAVVRTDD